MALTSSTAYAIPGLSAAEKPSLSFNDSTATLPLENIQTHAMTAHFGSVFFKNIMNDNKSLPVSTDELAAIRLFTTSWPDVTKSASFQLNQQIQSGQLSPSSAWMPLARLLYHAITKLPKLRSIVAASLDTADISITEGMILTSTSFASAVSDIDSLQDEMDSTSISSMETSDNARTLALIDTCQARSLHKWSRRTDESQYVFVPGARFEVTSVRRIGSMVFVQMRDAAGFE